MGHSSVKIAAVYTTFICLTLFPRLPYHPRMTQGPAIAALHSMSDVWDAYRGELDGVEDRVRGNLDSSVTLVNTVAAHILSGGGKRIRPLLLLLSARLCGYPGAEHHQLGSIVEFIHTATLLHDDVVDDADLRRGRRAARKVWGNQISILVGDYLYTKAMCKVVEFQNQGINEVLAEACNKMAEGEVLQLYYNGNPSMPEIEYIKIVEHKTAGLIAAACRMGPFWPRRLNPTGGAVPLRTIPRHRLSSRRRYLRLHRKRRVARKTIGQDLRQEKRRCAAASMQHCSSRTAK